MSSGDPPLMMSRENTKWSSMRCGLCFFGTCVALLVWPSRAEAQSDDDRQRAELLFEQGLRAMEAEDYGRAIEAYGESHRLHPHPGTLLNLALCQDAAGELGDARRSFEELLESYGDTISTEARERAERRLAELSAMTEGHEDAPQHLETVPDRAEERSSPSRLESTEPSTTNDEVAVESTAADTPRHMETAHSTERSEPLGDAAEHEPERRRRRRSFGRGPWPWIIGAAIISAGVATSLAVVLSQDDEEPEPQWWVHLP